MNTTTDITARLEALTLVRCAHRGDVGQASTIFYGSEDKGALVGSLAMLTRHLLRELHGEDVEETLSLLLAAEVASEVDA